MAKKFKQHCHNRGGNKTNYDISKKQKDMARSVGKGKKIPRSDKTPKYPGVCIREGDIKYLDSWKRNYTRDDLIFVTHGKHYLPVWFEEGKPDKQSGFGHMKQKGKNSPTSHAEDLNAVYHVNEKHIPLFLKRIIKKGKATNIKKRMKKDGKMLDGYDVTYKYKKRNVVIGIGDDGYIITAFPKKDKMKKRRKKK